MCKSKIGLAALLALAVVVTFFSGCGGCRRKATIIDVNGKKVMEKEFYARLEAVPVNSPRGQTRAGKYVIQQIIEQELILQLAEKKGVAPTDKQIAARIKRYAMRADNKPRIDAEYKRQMRQQQAYVNLVTKDIKIPEADIKKVYEEAVKAKSPKVTRPKQRFISSIVTGSKDKIDRAYKLLSSGTDFGIVALQLSDDPKSAQREGKQGWVQREFEPKIVGETAFGLGIGKYSKPLKVSQGDQVAWIIVKADKKRSAKQWTYAQVKDEIREDVAVFQASRKPTFVKGMEKFMREADITVGVDRYKDVPKEMKAQAAKAIKRLNEQLLGPGTEVAE